MIVQSGIGLRHRTLPSSALAGLFFFLTPVPGAPALVFTHIFRLILSMRTGNQLGGCPGMMIQTAAKWAQAEFGEAKLGDARRTARVVKCATALAETPGGTLPEPLAEWS